MQSLDDLALLREYAANNSEAAFAELVARRIGFVYAAALRQVREAHLAEEVTQAVFIILAQKAGKISDKTILAGWLFKTTRYTAIAQTREIVKRQRRELEAHMQNELSAAAPDPLWEQMSPLLDEALATLGETDRQAVLLRFFENKSLAEVGSALGTGEDTARKRVSRALEKLHRYFNKRGVSSTTAILAVVLTANSVQAAPVALANSVTAVALAKGAAASGSTLTLIKGALKIMAWTKAKTVALVSISLLLATGSMAAFWQFHFEKNSWQSRFDATYKLKDGEVIRYIAPPFINARAEYYRTKEPSQAKAAPRGPDFFIFKQDQNGHLQTSGMAYGYKQHTLQQILGSPLGFWRYEFEGPDELLNLNLAGDWTIREDANREALLAALDSILFKATGRKIHFEKRSVKRDVIVARGFAKSLGWQTKVKIYAEKPNARGAGMGFGNLQKFLGSVGEKLNIYIINEAQGDHFEWADYPDADYSKMGNQREELTDKVLRNLTTQTGLTFTREHRSVDVWFMVEEP